MHQVVYFSNVSENTKRFVEKLDVDAIRIPLNQKIEIPQVDKPFVLSVEDGGKAQLARFGIEVSSLLS